MLHLTKNTGTVLPPFLVDTPQCPGFPWENAMLELLFTVFPTSDSVGRPADQRWATNASLDASTASLSINLVHVARLSSQPSRITNFDTYCDVWLLHTGEATVLLFSQNETKYRSIACSQKTAPCTCLYWNQAPIRTIYVPLCVKPMTEAASPVSCVASLTLLSFTAYWVHVLRQNPGAGQRRDLETMPPKNCSRSQRFETI